MSDLLILSYIFFLKIFVFFHLQVQFGSLLSLHFFPHHAYAFLFSLEHMEYIYNRDFNVLVTNSVIESILCLFLLFHYSSSCGHIFLPLCIPVIFFFI